MIYKYLTKKGKAVLCAGLSIFLLLELVVSSAAISLSENSYSEETTSVSSNDFHLEEDQEDSSSDLDEDSDTYDDTAQNEESTSDDELSQEEMANGESIKATFYDIIDGSLVPFYDTKTGDPLLKDIIITRTEGSAYLNESFPEDEAYYRQKNPANPTPWLRIMPVRRGYQVVKWINTKSRRQYYAHTDENNPTKCLYDEIDFSNLKQDVSFEASYNKTPYVFSIDYHLNGGSLPAKSPKNSLPAFFTVTSDEIVLPPLEKKGYRFLGWYKDEAYKNPVSSIPKGSYIDSDAYGFVESYPLYAGWESLSPKRVTLTKVQYMKKGCLKIAYKKLLGVDGYEICFSTKRNFSKNVNTFDNKQKTSYVLRDLPKGTYYIKVRAYSYDSAGNKLYGAYSKTQKCKVKSGVSEYDLQKVKTKLKKVHVASSNKLVVQASISKRIKSADCSYYLVRVNAQNGKFDGSKKNIVSALPKYKTMQYEIAFTEDTKASLLQGCYALAIKNEKGYTLITKTLLVDNPEAAATYTAAFPKTRTPSKKGLQGAGGTSALGIQHFFFNMDVTQMLSTSADPEAICYRYNGKDYYFNLTEYMRTIRIANAQGLVVTGQLSMTWPGENKAYLIPSKARTAGHNYYSMNFSKTKARDEFEALFSCMAENFSTNECHLDNWILGNEVNMHRDWYYAGNISNESFLANYADAFRGMYYAVKTNNKNARVYICLDHNWAGDDEIWGARPFMDSFHKMMQAYNKKINWNLAYHLYPQNLANAATWKDSLATNKNTSPFVTPKNLDVLTKYVKKKFGSKTRIILSEQGFTSNSGTIVQAAAIAYTFYKAQFDDMIDAVIFHRYQDDPNELNAATKTPLNYGICTSNGLAKANSYHVFKYMDTPSYAQYTDPYLKIIGINSWKEIAPKFDAQKLINIP